MVEKISPTKTKFLLPPSLHLESNRSRRQIKSGGNGGTNVSGPGGNSISSSSSAAAGSKASAPTSSSTFGPTFSSSNPSNAPSSSSSSLKKPLPFHLRPVSAVPIPTRGSSPTTTGGPAPVAAGAAGSSLDPAPSAGGSAETVQDRSNRSVLSPQRRTEDDDDGSFFSPLSLYNKHTNSLRDLFCAFLLWSPSCGGRASGVCFFSPTVGSCFLCSLWQGLCVFCNPPYGWLLRWRSQGRHPMESLLDPCRP